jgi:hypothetical protein
MSALWAATEKLLWVTVESNIQVSELRWLKQSPVPNEMLPYVFWCADVRNTYVLRTLSIWLLQLSDILFCQVSHILDNNNS